MPSWQARAVSLYVRLTRKRRHRTLEQGERSLAHGLPETEPPTSLAGRVSAERMTGVQVFRVLPPAEADAGRGPLVYWHGGAFINGIARQHWQLVEHLATATGREVLVPRYALAPAHDVDDTLPLLEEVLQAVPGDLPVHVLGDSAGGTLALLQAQRHPDRVAGLTLIAPWLDLSMANPAVDLIEPHDPWLTRAGLRPPARAWAAGRDLRHPDVSPLFGDLERLPPTLVLVGDRDICLPDCELLAAQAPSVVTLRVGAGLPHVYPLLPIPEARPARAEIVQHIQDTLPR
ncbi:alpha/beta fold hydrolase [Ornithinimicrobium cryptoxanthini]|uniref:Alpha/beta hydrolase n=1 Tax=Ornithinimicrobium cryptoxanthini TaxID=2934161 RepID=A0ABY4YHA9_9MICO|nr:alpha/beta fold hydrolase [Ornithinimicrobium cryptoxanthini]USQ75994.1 alpha/beta hydrolase [Ornithinimicrobium cryptoxanthini]